jgi:hypothetical protein
VRKEALNDVAKPHEKPVIFVDLGDKSDKEGEGNS